MGETGYSQDAPVDSAWLACALEHLGLDNVAAARLLELDPDDLRLLLTGDEPVDPSLRDDLEAVCRFTARVTDRIADQDIVLVYRDDLTFMRALPLYADYSASWYQLVAFRASMINPDLEIVFDLPLLREPLSA